MLKELFRFSPAQILVLGFFMIVLLGAILLNLPVASKNNAPVGFVNALFTATSAVCVTGLAVVNTAQHWSVFGQWVILGLIQIGGLGFMTMVTFLFLLVGKKITLRERILIQESLNQFTFQGMVRLAIHVLIGTFAIEAIAAVLLAIRFSFDLPITTAIYWGVFHSISAFCNAGFDLTGNSMVPYVGDVLVNFVIMFLVIIGGLGFAVWMDLKETFELWRKKQIKGTTWKEKLRRGFDELTLHSKLVVAITIFLLVVGFVFFFIVEYNNPDTLGSLSFGDKILAAMMQSVVPRTAGFNSIDQAAMNHGSKFMTIILMFIGGSPGATAGGIKTVTAGILALAVISVLKGKEEVEAYHRRIPMDIVLRSLAVVVLGFTVVIMTTMVLALTETGASFEQIFFESTSAFATVGLSLGITPNLSVAGKLIIAMAMFLGRLGPITTALALMQINYDKNKGKISYPEERVLVG